MAGNMLGRKNSVSTALIRIRCAGLILHRSERRTRPAEEPAHWHSARWPVLHSRWGGGDRPTDEALMCRVFYAMRVALQWSPVGRRRGEG
jgi:hypothetical protein